MNDILVHLVNGNDIKVERGKQLFEIVEENFPKKELPYVLAKVDNELLELTNSVEKECTLDTISTDTSLGTRVYARTLQFILVKAVEELYPGAQITIEHSLSKGIFGEIHLIGTITEKKIENIKNKMQEIIDRNISIRKVSVTRAEAVRIFTEYNMEDKVRLIKNLPNETVKLYEMEGLYDYFYGAMGHATGIINKFDLTCYNPGFLLRYPVENNPYELPEFVERKKLAKIFYETEQWGKILGVGDVGLLNDNVESGEIVNIIRVAEALHEKKIAYIADTINARKNVKVVLIAGPSSSGKTTFAKRLGIQLRVNGLVPVSISLDDYFVNREETPRDENGEYDFESIYALDLELFNKNLTDLMNGDETEIPSYSFKTGKREWVNNKIKLPHNGVVVVEGIHGLNETLTTSIPKENKFKIYISALTQLNLDSHNRISTTDLRIIRRIVRDFLSRGYGGEQTLKMWPSIKRGEEKNIFVFQEEADVMFNSALVYELCILKKYALEELSKIDSSSSVYYEALRLKSFLHFFKEVDKEMVPDNSILREFTGGSIFYKY